MPHSMRKSGSGNRMTVSEKYRKFTNSRLYTCAAKVLLKIAVNATKCLTFESLYSKTPSTRAQDQARQTRRLLLGQ